MTSKTAIPVVALRAGRRQQGFGRGGEKGADRTAGCSETLLAGTLGGIPPTTLKANTQVISRNRLDGGCGWYTFPEFLHPCRSRQR